MVAVNFYGVGFFGPLPRGHKKPCPPDYGVDFVQGYHVGQPMSAIHAPGYVTGAREGHVVS